MRFRLNLPRLSKVGWLAFAKSLLVVVMPTPVVKPIGAHASCMEKLIGVLIKFEKAKTLKTKVSPSRTPSTRLVEFIVGCVLLYSHVSDS
jgi:hypothetical protein